MQNMPGLGWRAKHLQFLKTQQNAPHQKHFHPLKSGQNRRNALTHRKFKGAGPVFVDAD